MQTVVSAWKDCVDVGTDIVEGSVKSTYQVKSEQCFSISLFCQANSHY